MSNSHSSDGDAIDYTHYSLKELKEALHSIDNAAHPERAQQLADLVAERESHTLENTLGRENDSLNSTASVNEQVISQNRVKFHGSGSEYFSIWIVNLLLSIVTLGIYSAWATVRTNRYFYSNTEIGGHRLAYLAQPMQILFGRLIAFALFAVFFIASPIVAVVATLLFALLTPFIIVLGVRFRMRMMAYRNVRFNFTSRIGRAYVVFILYPIIGVLTLYLAMPWALKKIDEFLYENMTYGDKPFVTNLSTGEYYIAAIFSGLIGSLGVFIFGLMVVGSITGAGINAGDNLGENSFTLTTLISFIIYGFILTIAYSFYTAYIRNHVYNTTKISEVATFYSDLKLKDLVMVSITNYIMLIFSLGLAYPWTKVRITRLLTKCTEVSILSGIDDVVAKNGANENAVADEVIGAFDIDVSLG